MKIMQAGTADGKEPGDEAEEAEQIVRAVITTVQKIDQAIRHPEDEKADGNAPGTRKTDGAAAD